jgi:hypothetical protein
MMDNSGQFNTGYIDPRQMPVQNVQQGQQYMQTMQDAYMRNAQARLDPMWNQRQGDLESQLENMGLSRGSEAWTREMGNMSRGRNDAYGGAINQAILNSGAEAARMQGMDINAGNFANQAAQQGYQNQLTSQQARNQALSGQQQNALNAGTFMNQAQQQLFGQNMANANLNNQTLHGQADLANRLQVAQYQANAASAGARASASASRYAADMNARNQERGYGLDLRRLQNQERQQDFDMVRGMYRDPLDTQNGLTQGYGPPGLPSWGDYGQNVPGQTPFQGQGYSQQLNSGLQSQGDAWSSMGGSLLGGGVSLFNRWQGG